MTGSAGIARHADEEDDGSEEKKSKRNKKDKEKRRASTREDMEVDAGVATPPGDGGAPDQEMEEAHGGSGGKSDGEL